MRTFTILFFAAVAFALMSHSGGAGARQDADRTGGPVSDGFCAVCHSGGNFNAAVHLTLLGESGDTITNYVPGSTYTMRVEVTGEGASAYGFQAVALGSDLASAGSYGTPAADAQITEVAGRSYFEHSTRSTTGSWEIDWTAPAEGLGDIDFYFAGNAVNGANGTMGDQPVHDSLKIGQDQTSGFALQADYGLSIGPVPTNDILSLTWNELEIPTRIEIVASDGRMVSTTSVARQSSSIDLNVGNLPTGIYVLMLRSEIGLQSQRFLKR